MIKLIANNCKGLKSATIHVIKNQLSSRMLKQLHKAKMLQNLKVIQDSFGKPIGFPRFSKGCNPNIISLNITLTFFQSEKQFISSLRHLKQLKTLSLDVNFRRDEAVNPVLIESNKILLAMKDLRAFSLTLNSYIMYGDIDEYV